MFLSLIKSNLKSTIRDSMKDNLKVMTHGDLLNLFNSLTDNEFNIDLIPTHDGFEVIIEDTNA